MKQSWKIDRFPSNLWQIHDAYCALFQLHFPAFTSSFFWSWFTSYQCSKGTKTKDVLAKKCAISMLFLFRKFVEDWHNRTNVIINAISYILSSILRFVMLIFTKSLKMLSHDFFKKLHLKVMLEVIKSNCLLFRSGIWKKALCITAARDSCLSHWCEVIWTLWKSCSSVCTYEIVGVNSFQAALLKLLILSCIRSLIFYYTTSNIQSVSERVCGVNEKRLQKTTCCSR